MFFSFFSLRVRDEMRTIMLLLSVAAHVNVLLCMLPSQPVLLAWTVICSHSEDLIGVLMKVDLDGGGFGAPAGPPCSHNDFGGGRRSSHCSFTGFTANICNPVLFKHLIWLHPLN